MKHLTPERRRAIYAAATALLALGIVFDVIRAEDITAITGSIERIITALITLLAFLNTPVQRERYDGEVPPMGSDL